MATTDMLSYIQDAVVVHIQEGNFVISSFIKNSVEVNEEANEILITGVFKDIRGTKNSFEVKLQKNNLRCIDVNVEPYKEEPTLKQLVAEEVAKDKVVSNEEVKLKYELKLKEMESLFNIKNEALDIKSKFKIMSLKNLSENAGIYGVAFGWTMLDIANLIVTLLRYDSNITMKNLIQISSAIIGVLVYKLIISRHIIKKLESCYSENNE